MKKMLYIFLLLGCSFFLTSDSLGVAYYTLTVNVTGSGTVDRNPNQSDYESGTEVTLTAEPGKGWKFSEWTGDLSGSDNPETITMNSEKKVTAIFVKIPVTPSRNLLLLD